MRILFVTPDWVRESDDGPMKLGGNAYRTAIPGAELTRNGHETLTVGRIDVHQSGEIVGVTWDLERHAGWDVVVVHRWTHRAVPLMIKRARAYGQTIVFDLDDWLDGLPTSNAAYRHHQPRVSPNANVSWMRQAMAASDFITASTDYLAKRLERLGRPVVVVKNAIDLDRWSVSPAPQSDRPAVVGYIGSTPWHSGDLQILRGVLDPVLKRHGAVFAHRGHHPAGRTAGELAGVDSERCLEPVGMVSFAEYPSLFAGLTVGVVPLESSPFNESKSWLKGMELAASGVPFVASATSEYREFMPAVTAARSKDWVRQLDRLLGDERLRSLTSMALRARVEAHHDIRNRWVDWLRAYELACGVTVPTRRSEHEDATLAV